MGEMADKVGPTTELGSGQEWAGPLGVTVPKGELLALGCFGDTG